MKIGFRRAGSMSSGDGKSRIALLSLLALAAATANTANAGDCTPRLFGTSYNTRDDPAIFNSINIADGIGSQIGPVGFNRISAMDFDPLSDILYAVAERPADRQKVLISIDRQTGAGTQIAELSFGVNVDKETIAGMSFNSSGTLYGYGSWDQGFYTIDVSAGTIATLAVNDLDVYGNALAFSPGDILYHVGEEKLNTVDLTTGLPTLVADLLFNFLVDPSGIPAMDYAPETGSYYAVVKNGDQGEIVLATIDVTTGEVDRIGNTIDNLDGLAYFCEPVVIPEVVHADGFESP